MKISIDRNTLARALGVVNRAVEKRTTIPILTHVLLRAEDDFAIIGTDLEIQCRATCEAEISKRGTVCVPAQQLTDIAKKLPEGASISIEEKGDGIVVKSGRSRFTLSTRAPEDYPELWAETYPSTFQTQAQALAHQIKRVSFAISNEATRYYLNGIFLTRETGALRMVATDGHRLSMFDAPLPESAATMPSVIVPKKACALFERVLSDSEGEATVSVSNKTIRLEVGAVCITSRLIDASFPDYRRVIPSNASMRFTLPCRETAGAIARVATVVSERGHGVKCSFGPKKLALSVTNIDLGSAADEVEIDGDGDIEIGFSSRYLTDILAHFEDEFVVGEFVDAGSPAILRPMSSADHLVVLMPLRV